MRPSVDQVSSSPFDAAHRSLMSAEDMLGTASVYQPYPDSTILAGTCKTCGAISPN